MLVAVEFTSGRKRITSAAQQAKAAAALGEDAAEPQLTSKEAAELDFEAALVKLLGAGVLSLVGAEDRQIAETSRHVRMVGPQVGFTDF